MSATKIMIKAWIDAVLKPQVVAGVRGNIPLEELGEALLGYAAGVLRRGAGKTPDQIRASLEAVLASDPEN